MSKREYVATAKTDEKKTTITFALSPENKKAIKIYAAENDTTISALLNSWIEENCIVGKKK